MTIETFPARPAALAGLQILRALPCKGRRLVGPWCFMDCFGPLQFEAGKPLDVAPHPHIGLQTVSWLLEGEIIHKDSTGCESEARAGHLNLMTSGRGIAHSEETPHKNSGRLEGVQLWAALPDAHRHMAPQFNHYEALPVFNISSAIVTVFMGKAAGAGSPALAFSPIVGAEIAFREKQTIDLPLDPAFEHAVFPLRPEGFLEGRPLQPGSLHYIPPGRHELRAAGNANCRLLLIGGEPFGEPVRMWWNFVARTHEEMDAARQDWIQHARFGGVKGYSGPRVEAPELRALIR